MHMQKPSVTRFSKVPNTSVRCFSILEDVFMSEDRQRQILFAEGPPVDMLATCKDWEVILDNAYGGTSQIEVIRSKL
jgi:hypothetical protein